MVKGIEQESITAFMFGTSGAARLPSGGEYTGITEGQPLRRSLPVKYLGGQHLLNLYLTWITFPCRERIDDVAQCLGPRVI
jgi:hypothetical protein